MIKTDSRDMLQKIIFQINAALLILLFIKESWKKYNGLHKVIKLQNAFNIDKIECYLGSKSA